MRKLIAISIILCILLVGCGKKNDTSNNNTQNTTGIANNQTDGTNQPSITDILPTALKVSDFFPFTKDVHMKYKGTGNKYAQFDSYVDYVKNDTIQMRENNGGTETVIVYKIADGALKKVFSRGETYYKYDYTSMSAQDEILIKEPIKEGTEWTITDGTRKITAVDKQIDTPAGNYKAIEVTTELKDSTIKDYYAKDVGLVKTVFTSNEDSASSVMSELEKIETNVPFKHTVRFYFPEFEKDRVAYIERDVEIKTNEDMKFKFQKELKTIPSDSGLSKTLSTNASVLSTVIDEEKGIVTVDLSQEFITEMNAGSSLEGMLIKSVANTFGTYYQKDKVVITIAGKLYESGHQMLKEGEYFTVDNDNTVEYK